MLLWISGVLILLAVGLLTYILTPHHHHTCRLRKRLRRNRLVLRLMKRILHNQHPCVQTLDALSAPLTEQLQRMNQSIAAFPPLPLGADGEPRVMAPAREAADAPEITGASLTEILQHESADTIEILAFPACVALAQSQRLTAVFKSVLSDISQMKQARKLLRKLQRCNNPALLLEKSTLNTCGLAELLRLLEEQQQESLLAVVINRLQELELLPSDLQHAAELRNARYDDEFRRAYECLAALQRLEWTAICSAADETHEQLLKDPGGLYPRLDVPSQLQLRLDVSKFSRLTGIPAAEVIQSAFTLCEQAAGIPAEGCAAYYCQSHKGIAMLRRSLSARCGWLYSHLKDRHELLHYAVAWFISITTGLGFLQSGQPVILLPFFLILTGCLHRIHKPVLSQHIPGLQLTPGDPDLRTLVVLHADMATPAEAASAVTRLKSIIRSFHGEPADFLLIGDFLPCITAVSGYDMPMMQTAADAIAALRDDRVMYLHRGRVWDDKTHCYRARSGQRGAITELCRLMSTGISQDPLVHATIVPSSLERRYAYLLVLGADTLPAPGLLTRFLSVITNPLYSPYPAEDGMRGHALLLPAECSNFDGTAFIRPDAFLEATDNFLPRHEAAYILCGELAGQFTVDGAHIFRHAISSGWDQHYLQTVCSLKIFPWLLPIVPAASGWIDNPLSFFQRFRLREYLRRALVPLSQLALLLWGLLSSNWPLMLLSLFLPETGVPLSGRTGFLSILSHICLLPTRAAADVAAVIQLLRRKPHFIPDWTTMEAWVQGMSAACMAALIFIYPDAAVGAFALAVLFACFPWVHRAADSSPF